MKLQCYLPCLIIPIITCTLSMVSAQVSPEWVKFYASPTDESDWASEIEIDIAGNLLVAGYTDHVSSVKDSIVLLKYDPEGALLFKSIHVPASGSNVEIADLKCRSDNHYFLLYTKDSGKKGFLEKTDSDGNVLWSSQISNAAANTHVKYILLGASGNIYVTGNYYYPDDSDHVFVQKFDDDGNLLSKGELHSAGSNNFFYLNDAALDEQENIYLCGGAYESGDITTEVGFLAKFDSSSVLQWYNENYYHDNDTRFIYVDSNDHVYTAGYVKASVNYCYWCITGWVVNRFDAFGNSDWSITIDSTNQYIHLLSDEQTGHLLVCGSNGTVGLQYFRLIADSTFIEAHKCTDSALVGNFSLLSVMRDAEGNFYGCGETSNGVAVMVFNQADSLVAEGILDTTYIITPTDFVLSGDDAVYFTGWVYHVYGIFDMVISKFCFSDKCHPLPTSSPENQEPATSLKIVPNPISSSATLIFSTGERGDAAVSVFDLAGRIVQSFLIRNLNAGEHAIDFQRNNIPAGVYIVEVKGSMGTALRKIVIE